jgi:hypothetical protein
MLAHRSPTGIGAAAVHAADDAWLAAPLALRLAERGLVGVCAWSDGRTTGVAIAGPTSGRPWIARTSRPTGLLNALAERAPATWIHALVAATGKAAPQGFIVVAARMPSDESSAELLGALQALDVDAWSGALLASHEDDARRGGLRMTRAQFAALAAAGAALLVPEEDEPRVLAAGVDPLKVF